MLYPENILFVITTSFIYSLIEIELEAKNGWMANIPTANTVFFGGKYLTLYHVYMIIMIIMMVCFQNRMEFTINGFLHSASYVFLFLLLEDVLWFIYNPYFTIKKYKQEHIWWHASQPWIMGIPFHNYFLITINLLLAWYTQMSDIYYSVIISILFVVVSIPFAPMYHRFYNYMHKKETVKTGPAL